MTCFSKTKLNSSHQVTTCDGTAEGGVSRKVNRTTSLRCACYFCDWPSCPLACRVMKVANQHEGALGARWGGWAHRTGGEVAVGVQSPLPGDYTGCDRTGSNVTHGATTAARGDSHLAQSTSDPTDRPISWLARKTAPRGVTAGSTHSCGNKHSNCLWAEPPTWGNHPLYKCRECNEQLFSFITENLEHLLTKILVSVWYTLV